LRTPGGVDKCPISDVSLLGKEWVTGILSSTDFDSQWIGLDGLFFFFLPIILFLYSQNLRLLFFLPYLLFFFFSLPIYSNYSGAKY